MAIKSKGLVRRFDGVRYDFQRTARTKKNAKDFAKQLRRRGTKARVIRVGDHYEVFAKTT